MRRCQSGGTLFEWRYCIYLLTCATCISCQPNKVDTQIDVVGSQVILKIDRGVICDLEDSHASNTNVGALFRLERLVGDLVSQSTTSQDQIKQLQAVIKNQSLTFQAQLDDLRATVDKQNDMIADLQHTEKKLNQKIDLMKDELHDTKAELKATVDSLVAKTSSELQQTKLQLNQTINSLELMKVTQVSSLVTYKTYSSL